ncbi:phosphate ABC transporter substrate-binding protein PstS [Jatrophihabitans telluris]|uniref:Phosphate-binding protein n=1 Tax=Jatrophihabitans telluris TaxID=2038343 RepID=A0ABY4QYZ1_9ACTN|nr:phosphate ABC transporter substrate-binding protein PstS [Jatrophihabitans telluris]UQX88775.1 phosphate ABC transporter substrate-binding protein PstS [Jatrophihabitans telluris]
MQINRIGIAAGLLAAAIALTACGSDKSTSSTGGSSTTGSSSSSGAAGCGKGNLTAEGSTAQQNAMAQWIKDYQTKCGVTVTYNGTGSGAGVSNFIAKQDDFAGSDSALDPTKDEIAKAQTACGSPAVDIPMVVGPIAVAYKVNGVTDLTLTPQVLAKIFLGKITAWNDPAIKAINSSATLPTTKITVFYRSDSSGTTQNFEKYLAANDSTDFTTKPDKDSSKAGFAGQGKTGSQGVQQAIGSTDGAIGYVEWSFAVSGNLNTAKIDNGSGAVDLNADSAGAAVAAAKVASNGGQDLTLKLDYATKAKGAYPIILVTYEIACSKYADSAKGASVKGFLTYTSSDGQASLKDLGYAPLPSEILTKVQATVASIS